MTALIKIGDAAKLAGVPSRTLNRYRTQGLIVAERFEGEGRSGGAYFTAREVAIARAVRHLLTLGLTAAVVGVIAQRWRDDPELEITGTTGIPGTNVTFTITDTGAVLPAEQPDAADAAQLEMLATG